MTQALAILRGAFGRVALLDMDTSLVDHAHHHCHVILKASGPDQEFSVAGRSFPLREDTAILVNTWEPHHYLHRAGPECTVFLALYIEPSWLVQVDRSFAASAQAAFFERPCVPVDAGLARLRGELVRQILGLDHNPAALEELIRAIVIALVYRFGERVPASLLRLSDYRIRRALQLMKESASTSVDLDAVAREAGLSRPHFNTLFRRCTGLSPAVYANAVRIEAAVDAVCGPSAPIGSVSDELGFSAPSNFARFFQQHTGVAPGQFRRVVAEIG
ncbi:MAG: helix-turn-helix domain-containing protein [Beijerinckiaceae bacterium]